MIKTILWDFDGVIFNSMKIKADGFLELFKEYDDLLLKKIEEYHYLHGGVSRFDKIRYFYNNILKQEISEEEVISLSNKFAAIIEKRLFDEDNLIMDSVKFIKNNYLKYRFHIVSGAEHNELNTLCKTFDLSKYFITIEGSPTKKNILIKNILEKYNYKKDETILIGDSITDYNAAMKNNIKFYGYNNIKLKKLDRYIDSFQGVIF
jgi:phosphoglycolate phosphatase-like HAD superfamily hydrolase